MTQEEIIEYNKRCAEFLDFKYRNSKKAWAKYPLDNNSFLALKGWLSMDRLQFHLDWNWIMEVVEAIQKIRPLIISHNHCEIHMYDEGKNISINITTNSTKISVVQVINQFLIWYEQNK